jgi:hypothetical protein
MNRRYLTAFTAVSAVGGISTMIALTNGAAGSVGGIWTLSSIGIAGAFLSTRSRAARVAIASATLIGCVLLGWVGGLFMLPAALGLLLLAWSDKKQDRPQQPPSAVTTHEDRAQGSH